MYGFFFVQTTFTAHPTSHQSCSSSDPPPPSPPPSPPPPGIGRVIESEDDLIQVLIEPHGQAPLTLNLSGTHDISGNWSAQTTASEIWLETDSGATLSGVLNIYGGAPPIHIKGFEITARIDVEALAPLEISDCKFRRADSRRRLEENENKARRAASPAP